MVGEKMEAKYRERFAVFTSQKDCQTERLLLGFVKFITFINYLEYQVDNEVTNFADTTEFFKVTK